MYVAYHTIFYSPQNYSKDLLQVFNFLIKTQVSLYFKWVTVLLEYIISSCLFSFSEQLYTLQLTL